MKTGVFGGTFNPIHCGHIKLADFLLAEKHLDSVIFVPAAFPPLKKTGLESFAARHKMAENALKEKPELRVSEIEMTLPAPSYSLKTMRELKKLYPEESLYFIIGTDNIYSIHSWYKHEELIKENNFIVLRREKTETPPIDKCRLSADLYNKLTSSIINSPLIEISSTAIRNLLRVKNFKELEKKLPGAVLDYIRENHLYTGN